VTKFGVAGTRADRFFRFADLMRHAPPRRSSAAILEHLAYTDRNAALDPSSILVTKAGPISDKPPPIDKKSLFDAVPYLKPLCGSHSGFEVCRLNRGKKSTAKEP
jgi:hypothetical protein